MISKKSDRLLETDIHQLATSRRFSESADPTRMTLEVPQEWRATFERATSTEEWDRLLRYCQRMPNHIYLAAVEACQGRDSRSQRRAEARERCSSFLDSI